MAQKVVMILFYFVCYNTLLQLGSPLLYLQRISPQVLLGFTARWRRGRDGVQGSGVTHCRVRVCSTLLQPEPLEVGFGV